MEEDFLLRLKALRGEFENSRIGRIGNQVLAHVFSAIFPICFLGYLFFFTDLNWPLAIEQWLFLVLAFATLVMGLMIQRSINSRYVFDDEGIKEYRANDQLRTSIKWSELQRVEYRECRGIKTFLFITEHSALQLEFYKSISEALSIAEKTIALYQNQ